MRILPIAVCASLAAFAHASPGRLHPDVAPIVREQQTVLVHGRLETWRLEWRGPPAPYSSVKEEVEYSFLACPCIGFAYGETGDLWLVRVRNGREIEHLPLSPFFRNDRRAILQRWPQTEDDIDIAGRNDFPQVVLRRPVVMVMHFADYDHDGAATEFYLQTDAEACGLYYGVVIGVSARNSSLHVFGTASSPDRPLYLRDAQWDALRRASTSPVRVPGWNCGNHGRDTQAELFLRWSAAGIDGTRSVYTCPPPGKARRLLERKPLAAVDET